MYHRPLKEKPDYIAAVVAISESRGLIASKFKVKAAFDGGEFIDFIKTVVTRVKNQPQVSSDSEDSI